MSKAKLQTKGHSNRYLERSCFDKNGNVVDEEKLIAIRRWDEIEERKIALEKMTGQIFGLLSEYYCIADMLDDKLFLNLIEKYKLPKSPLKRVEKGRDETK